MDPADRNESFDEIKWNVLESELGVTETEKGPAPPEQPVGVKLPVEPAPAAEALDPAGATAARHELLNFFYYGHRESEDAGDMPEPALLYQHRDLSRVRHEYPVCLTPTGPNAPGRTLAHVFDELIEATAGDDSDTSRRFRQHAMRLEFTIRSISAGVNAPGLLSDVCAKASEELLATPGLSKNRLEQLHDDVEKIRQALPFDGDVISCSAHAPERLFESAMAAFWHARSAKFLVLLDNVIRETKDILDSADSRSDGARSAGQLAESSGEEDQLDYEAMSDILGQSDLADPLPADRRKRIEDVLATLRQIRPLYAEPEDGEKPPFPMETVVNDCPAAERLHASRMTVMTDFFRALRIARLEVDNNYRPEVHDAFFTHFDPNELTDGELSFGPPVLMRLDSAFIKKARKIELLSLFASDTPVKLLIELGDLCHNDQDGNAVAAPAWTTQIAAMVSAMGNVYVSQATASRPSLIHDSMMDGMRYTGPALFSVYCPAATDSKDLDPYLLAAAAEESRLFPSFTYHPGQGSTLTDRVSVVDNPQNDQIWPLDTFHYQTDQEEQRETTLPFTPADYLLADVRFKRMFWNVPPSRWREELVPLSEYLEAIAAGDDDDEDAPARVPFLTAVDADGAVCRVVPTREILTVVDRATQSWRGLQEMGGIDNSHALALIAGERERLAEELKRELEAIEQKYSSELERDVGALSQEIIRRIAGQLIAQGQAAPAFNAFPAAPAPAATPAPATEATEAAAPAEVREEEDEDEAVTFDDPYIDTPLCTSCNDCMKFNSLAFQYNENKQAYIADLSTATYEQLVKAAEKCPVHIIHPGKPKNSNEPNLDDLVARAAKFN